MFDKTTLPTMELTLCSKCASHYYYNKNYWIDRSDLNQQIYEECMICHNPHGFDFKIWDLSTMRKEKSQNCGGVGLWVK